MGSVCAIILNVKMNKKVSVRKQQTSSELHNMASKISNLQFFFVNCLLHGRSLNESNDIRHLSVSANSIKSCKATWMVYKHIHTYVHI